MQGLDYVGATPRNASIGLHWCVSCLQAPDSFIVETHSFRLQPVFQYLAANRLEHGRGWDRSILDENEVKPVRRADRTRPLADRGFCNGLSELPSKRSTELALRRRLEPGASEEGVALHDRLRVAP